MKKNELEQYLENIVEITTKNGKITGDETWLGAGAVLRMFPESKLSQKDAEKIANEYNLRVEEVSNIIKENKKYIEKIIEITTENGKITGDETWLGANAVLRMFPEANLSIKEAEIIADGYNSRIEEAKEAAKAAEEYAKDGVTAEEAEVAGNIIEEKTAEADKSIGEIAE